MIKLLLFTILLFPYSTTFAQFGKLFDALKEVAEPKIGNSKSKNENNPSRQDSIYQIPGQTSQEDVFKNKWDHIYTWVEIKKARVPGGTSFQFENRLYFFKGKYHPDTFHDRGNQAMGENPDGLHLNNQLIRWCKIKRERYEEESALAAQQRRKIQQEEADKQRELTNIKLENDYPRVKEVGNSMKSKTFVFKSIYLGMPVWDAKSALLATGVGDVQENDNNQTFIKNKIVLEDKTVSHDVISTLKSKKPQPPFGASNKDKMTIDIRFAASKIIACNGVEKGFLSNNIASPDGKIDVINITEDGLKDLFKFDEDIDLSTLKRIISDVYDIEFTDYSSFVQSACIHVDYEKGFALRLMSNAGMLSMKLLKIPSVSEIKMAKQAAEEATKKKIESARSAFD